MNADQLAAIQARADAASEGPWDAARGANADGTTYATTYAEKTEFLALSLNNNRYPLWLVASDSVIPAATGDGPRAKANAEFIAHARTDVPALLALVREQAAKLDRLVELAESWKPPSENADLDDTQVWYSFAKHHAAQAIRNIVSGTP